MSARKMLLFGAIAGALMLGACSPDQEARPVVRPEVSGVELGKVIRTTVPESFETTGTVVSRTSSTVSSRIMGAVTSLAVNEGDRVRAGQVLLTIDDRDLREKVRAAEEAYNEAVHALASARGQEDLAVKTYERYRTLQDEKAITTQELDNVFTQAEQAKHGVEQAEAMVKRAGAARDEAKIFLGFSTVASPIDGIVTSKMTNVGSMASPGVPLLQLEDRDSRLVQAGFEERMLEAVMEGMEVRVRVPSNAVETMGKIVEVVPTVDPRTRTFLVKIEVPGLDLRSGQYGTVRFESGVRDLLLVPASAVVSRGQLTGVFLVNADSHVIYRLIRAGRPYGEMVEVLSGLAAGDTIVVGNLDRAVDGGVLVRPGSPEGEN
ncbi:MAG: efflux RND transporter periplasmic adaptor subunit [bacterium]|nr:efflux RND transporter periplasmic adaptor subunit [bacterium]MDT8396473.1 efflux RND transporter periplasmic adaptor subunit [bacterium]